VTLLNRLAARREAAAGSEDVEAGKPGFKVVAPPLAQPAQPKSAPTPQPSTANVANPQAGAPTITDSKNAIHALLVERHADKIDLGDREGVRSKITEVVDEYLRDHPLGLNRLDYGNLIESLLDDVIGLGPLQSLLEDRAISEIMINHHKQVFIERAGRLVLSPVTFESAAQLRQIIDRIVSTIGRRVDESSPMCDARLRDGSRVNVVLPPLALDGPCMTIRKFARDKLQPDDLIAMGSATPDMIRYLEVAVRTKLNVLVSGGTSSGKTTLLNVLSSFIPTEERIVTVEDAAELQLRQAHVIRLEARPPNVEGKGAVEIRDLVRNSLRMRPDRIVVGECRGGEALDMLQAMNTGHEGSMSTVHANSPYDALNRLETMVLMAGTDLPARAIQKQIASAIDIVVQAERLRGGARKIVSIAEITGLENGEPRYQEIFQFKQTGVDEEGSATGYHTALGQRSVHLEHFSDRGEHVPEAMFEAVPRPMNRATGLERSVG
jgi:pilus assembly protein CpaF